VTLQSWMIKSWPPCEWYLPPDPDDWPAWWHMSTHVREDRDVNGRYIGDTVWMASVEGTNLAATWEWTELRPGVVVLSDPNSILSNVRFILDDTQRDEELAATVELNRIANVLPWQRAVCAVLKAFRDCPEMMSADEPAPHIGVGRLPRSEARRGVIRS